MSCICNKCKYLWAREGKKYCIKTMKKYKINKKQCSLFEEGSNIKKYLKKGWWRDK